MQFADPKDMVPKRSRSSMESAVVEPPEVPFPEQQAGPDLLTQAIEQEFAPEVQHYSQEVVLSLPGVTAPITSTPYSAFGEQELFDVDVGPL